MENFAAGREDRLKHLDLRLGQIAAPPPAPLLIDNEGVDGVGRGRGLGRNQKLAKLSAYPLCPSDSPVKIVSLARILLNERIFFSYRWFRGRGKKEAAVSAVKLTQNKSEKANSHSPGKIKEKSKEKSVFSALPATKWKFFNCIFANCRSGLLASNSFQWKLQRKIFSHRQHKSCIRLRPSFPSRKLKKWG